MKKVLLLAISILMVTSVFARKSGLPIPSYNFPLKSSAYFQEDLSRPGHNNFSDEKRDVNVTNEGAAGSGPVGSAIIVYVYRLDGTTTMGPYYVPSGETRTISIDGHSWGVYALTLRPTYISVWTTDDL
ncbi:MAG: hypothetical protein NTW10_01450 [Bacteroidetes bacterium]|nr:hypothetical protein [Bacteroidota bacterium]